MATPLFGIDADAVRRHHFPNFPAFSTNSQPTLLTVGEQIVDAGADLAGRLRLKNIDPTAIDALGDANTYEAFAWCHQTLRIDVAIRIWSALTGTDPPKELVQRLKDRFEQLEEGGSTALGSGAVALTSASEPEGPFTHISEHSLTTADTTLMSDATPPFRKADEL